MKSSVNKWNPSCAICPTWFLLAGHFARVTLYLVDESACVSPSEGLLLCGNTMLATNKIQRTLFGEPTMLVVAWIVIDVLFVVFVFGLVW